MVTYMTELLGRVPTISIPIFNGIQKFRLACSSKQVFIQMIAPMGLTLSVKVILTKSTNSRSSGACFRAANVFSFEALFANNPFWCPNQKHVSNSRLGKLNQVMDLVTENATKFKMAEKISYCYNDFSY